MYTKYGISLSHADNFVKKTRLGYIPAVKGLVLILRANIRSSGSEMGGIVTTIQTLNTPTFSSTE